MTMHATNRPFDHQFTYVLYSYFTISFDFTEENSTLEREPQNLRRSRSLKLSNHSRATLQRSLSAGRVPLEKMQPVTNQCTCADDNGDDGPVTGDCSNCDTTTTHSLSANSSPRYTNAQNSHNAGVDHQGFVQTDDGFLVKTVHWNL